MSYDFFIHVKPRSWYLILYLLLEDAGNEIIVKADAKAWRSWTTVA